MNDCCGEKLIAISVAVAIEIAKINTPEDTAILAAFFTTLGDQLALLSITKEKNNCIKKL